MQRTLKSVPKPSIVCTLPPITAISRSWLCARPLLLRSLGPKNKLRVPCSLSRPAAENSGDTSLEEVALCSDTELSASQQQEELEAGPSNRCTGELVPEVRQTDTLGWRRSKRKLWTSRSGLTLLAAGGLLSGFPGSLLSSVGASASTLSALAVLTAIVTIHECGHFLAAKLQNVHVKEFSIGFGPKLFSYQGPEVNYCLRTIPLGGYVAFPDDDPKLQYPVDDPDLLNNRPILDRAAVISAGVIANVIFAWSILFTEASTIGMAEPVYAPGVRIPELASSSVAAQAGMRSGDIILRIGKKDLPASAQSVPYVVHAIVDSPEREMILGIRRGEQLLDLPVTPALAGDGGGRLGVQLVPNISFTHRRAADMPAAALVASKQLARCFGIVLGGLWQVASNFAGASSSLSGPVAIVAAGADAAKADRSGLFQFAALININLAVVNVLPLPALDGGYLALLVVEGVRGKKLPKGIEQGIMASGLLALMGLGVVLIVRDTINLGGLR